MPAVTILFQMLSRVWRSQRAVEIYRWLLPRRRVMLGLLDGQGEYGAYTSQLMEHMGKPGKELVRILESTSQDVKKLTDGKNLL